jgi:hypothetical protein
MGMQHQTTEEEVQALIKPDKSRYVSLCGLDHITSASRQRATYSHIEHLFIIVTTIK